ncbi:MAG: hypothetical protein LBL95_09295 [Deltaproteobacteria bacterium]|jgi:NitT/TauT family transport system permease protein|nr:hypothetical protein [Deltaproteobacteria bacterium]
MVWYGILGFLALWRQASFLGLRDRRFIPPASENGAEALVLLGLGELFVPAATSAQRPLLGLAAAVALALHLAALMSGLLPRLAGFLASLVALLSGIDPFDLFPFFILPFGVGEMAKSATIFWSGLFPILDAAIKWIAGCDPLLLKAGPGPMYAAVLAIAS